MKRDSRTHFSLTAVVYSDNKNPTRIPITKGTGANNSSLIFYIDPPLAVKSNTLAISREDNIYENMGVSFDSYNDDYGSAWPRKETLAMYKNLIIFAEEYNSPISKVEKLQTFLDKNGNCLVHGHKIIANVERSRSESRGKLVDEYFHAKYKRDYDGQKKVSGIKGDFLTDGLMIDLQETENESQVSAVNSIEYGVLETLPGATPIFVYPTGEVAGIRVDGKYKLVYLEFALHEIKSLETRKELMRRILAWFNGK